MKSKLLGIAASMAGVLGIAFVPTLASAATAPASLPLGPFVISSHFSFSAYYDAHKDTFLVSDVSNKAQAVAMKINYAPELKSVKGAPFQYFIVGNAAAGQISVLGSEPGESDYNPLWDEIIVKWKAGVTPVLLTSDDQINSLAKKHELTKKDAHIILNAPVLSVGK